MTMFTTEAAVRLKFQVNDTAWAPAALVNDSIANAHAEILRRLDPATPVEPPAEALMLGETWLAGAHLLRSLASKDAVQQKDVVVGGQRIETGKRFAALIALSERAEREAWAALEPFLLAVPAERLAAVTESTPVLGRE